MRTGFDRLRIAMAAAGAAMLATVLPIPAPASISIAGGGTIRDNPAQIGIGAIVSTGASIPAIPLELQGSVFVPVTGKGGYAATAEIRGFTGGGFGGAYIGAGAGIGTLSADESSGTVLTIFAGKSIAPLTSVEFRLYKQTQSLGATVGFAGVRFSF